MTSAVGVGHNMTDSLLYANSTDFEDFQGVNQTLFLGPEEIRACVNISIISDSILEYSETFFVFISSNDPTVEIVAGFSPVSILDRTSVIIIDNCD